VVKINLNSPNATHCLREDFYQAKYNPTLLNSLWKYSMANIDCQV
jgi:hypothetical protein